MIILIYLFESVAGSTSTPSTDPTPSPTTPMPTTDPTPLPTLDYWITSNYSLTLNADYEAFDAYTQSNATKQEAMALEIVENGIGIDDDQSLSDHLEITISDVRSGSIIIDYVLSTNNELLIETALSNMDDSMGTSMVFGSLTFIFSSNSPITMSTFPSYVPHGVLHHVASSTEPICITLITAPTDSPSVAIAPEESLATAPDSSSQTVTLIIIVVAVFAFVMLICCSVIMIRCFWSTNLTASASMEMQTRPKSSVPKTDGPIISNGLVVGIGIGEYESDDWQNLNVKKDLQNLQEFSNFLGYEFMSNHDKIYWTKEEILSYLRNDVGAAFFTKKGGKKYDGLLVCVSGHGVLGHVVTSKLEYVEKTAISRCICENYHQFVDIPRIVMFDACSGARERQSSLRSIGGDESNEAGKGDVKQHIIAMHSEEMSGDMTPKDNPADIEGDIGKAGDMHETGGSNKAKRGSSVGSDLDRNTAVIHAANSGYQAKMRGDIGSYLLSSFIYAVQTNQAKHEQKGLEELMEEIQNGLHKNGRQQTESIFNDTKNLRMERKVDMKNPYAF